jgi:hypothetical protein
MLLLRTCLLVAPCPSVRDKRPNRANPKILRMGEQMERGSAAPGIE